MGVADETVKVMSASIAPVFLISGVGVILSSMTLRYGRIIDRVRGILDTIQQTPNAPNAEFLRKELGYLYKRAVQLRTTIILASTSIFCISLTIALIFAELMFDFLIPFAAEALFIFSLIFLLLSLALFIQDFALSLQVMKLEVKMRLKERKTLSSF